jgi:uncharacterized membrane protein
MDDLFFVLLGLTALGAFFAPVILSLVAMSRTGALKRKIASLEARLAGLDFPGPSAAPIVGDAQFEVSAAPSMETPAAPEPILASPDITPEITEPAATIVPPAARPTKVRVGIEERLTSRWLVWLGAVALILAGIFLIKYSIDNALLTPAMRAVLGLLLGAALVAGGEWLRRRPLQRQFAAVRPDQVPGALTSAGLFISFATVYAAYALLQLISPATAFAGLAIVALIAFALAALHPPIVAIIGLLAGFATPALVESAEPNPALLFTYLALIDAAAYAVVIYRAWGWLAHGAILGSFVWVAVWILGPMAPADILVIGLFLAAVTAASIWLALYLTPPEAPIIWQKSAARSSSPELNGWIAASGSVLLFALAVTVAKADAFGVTLAALASLAAALAGRRWQRFDGLIAHASALLVLTLLAWNANQIIADVLKDQAVGNIVVPTGALMATGAESFVFAHIAAAALLAGVGFVLLRGALRPFLWAGASILGAVAILASCYAKIHFLTSDTFWALTASASAALAVGAAGVLNRRREEWPYRLSLGFYAAAAVAGIAFAFAFVFREAWLTVALSLQLPALTWLEKKLDLKELRYLALAVASAVLVRLALNPYVLNYDASLDLGSQWVLYGYGIPAAAFYATARQFGWLARDRTVIVLESGALAFALLLISLEIRIFVEGHIASQQLSLFELSLHTLVWLTAGWWRLRAYRLAPSGVDRWWSAILIGLGLAGVIFGQLLILNPVMSGDPVGTHAIINVLLVAYLVPAILIALIAREIGGVEILKKGEAVLYGVALVIALIWLTLETKRAFQGTQLTSFSQSDAEYYAYSVVWLLASFLLLGVGIWRGTAWLRHAALAVLILTVLKVFLLDMAALGGLYRVTSFLGLGLCLVGIGYLYQRFVFKHPLRDVTSEASNESPA